MFHASAAEIADGAGFYVAFYKNAIDMWCDKMEISTFTDRYSRVFSGNTYAQIPGFSWLTYYGVEGTDDRAQVEMHRRHYMTDPKKAILEKLQDTTAKIVSF